MKNQMQTKDCVSARPENISFQAPPDLAAQLRKMAQQNSRTVSGEIRHLVKQAVQQREMKQAA